MAEQTQLDRLQPCLLDRIRDDEPTNPKESRTQRLISLREYRKGVLEHLSWLLNTSQHPATDGLSEFPEAEKSVLNFGIPEMSGLTSSSIDPLQLKHRIAEAIRQYEPRILPQTLEVSVNVAPDHMTGNAVSFEIRGQLWAQPMPDPLYVKTDMDLETGQFDLKGPGNG